MKLKIYIYILLTTIILGYYLFINQKNNIYHIAILQSCSHPSLDEARNGFINKIRSQYKDNEIKISYFNGEGSASNIYSLAKQLTINKNINAFFAIGSQPTQSIYKLEKERPLFIAAVSDPLAIGINDNTSNVSGISDMVEKETPLYILNNIIPHTTKIGLIYSQSALNENEAKKIKQNLELNGKKVFEIIIHNEQEIDPALDINLSKIEVLLSLCDNIVAATIPQVIKKTISNKIPFIACFNDATKHGALASCGTDYYQDGIKIAENAIQIIKQKKKINEIGVQKNKSKTIYVNKETASILNIAIKPNENIILI